MGKRWSAVAVTMALVAATVVWEAAPAHAAATYTTTMVNETVHVGPGDATACTIVGELFVPSGASAANPQPAILTTNGFGGSYKDQIALAEYAAGQQNYVVLTYSGLGFGGSGCNIELDSPEWDGAAASQLVTYLGTLPEVKKDAKGPIVGMIGGSYGGAVQFAAASIDPRIRAIVPIITWNDLGYSLAPSNDHPDFNFTDSPPGVLKFEWTAFFFALGATEPIQNLKVPPAFPPSSCPGFDARACPDLAASAGIGYPNSDTLSLLRNASMVTYGSKVHAATMLMQGEDDTLFNIDEAVANYHQLQANGAPVKLVLQSWGHSHATPAPGELSYTSEAQGYETALIDHWFDHYLRGESVSTGPAVEYFQPWVSYAPSGSAQPAYAQSDSWPVGKTAQLFLSGASPGALVGSANEAVGGTQSFINTPASESYSETSAVQDMAPFSSIPPTDVPGSFASYETAALPETVDSVGIPTLHFTLDATVPPLGNPALEPVIFAKLYDVAPDGSMTLADRIVSPTRVANPGSPMTVTLPGVVHQYPAGDRIDLVVAATDTAYLGSRAPNILSIPVDPTSPPVLSLPVIGATQLFPPPPGSGGGGGGGSPSPGGGSPGGGSPGGGSPGGGSPGGGSPGGGSPANGSGPATAAAVTGPAASAGTPPAASTSALQSGAAESAASAGQLSAGQLASTGIDAQRVFAVGLWALALGAALVSASRVQRRRRAATRRGV